MEAQSDHYTRGQINLLPNGESQQTEAIIKKSPAERSGDFLIIAPKTELFFSVIQIKEDKIMNAIFQLVNPSNTVTINRPLAHALGLNEAVIYGALISKFYYYSERGMLNDGWFYSTAPDLAESTALSERQQKRAVDNLIGAGLIRSELRGMPAKRSFYIVEDIALLQRLIADGEAKMREIKPAASERYERKREKSANASKQETQGLIDFLSAGLGNTPREEEKTYCVLHKEFEEKPPQNAREAALLHCSDISSEQESTKRRSKDRQNVGAPLYIKPNINNLNFINPSIPRASGEYADGFVPQTEREFYFSLLKEKISYTELCERHKYDKSQIDELLGIMLDVICSGKPMIRVNGDNMPTEVVKNVFLRLDDSHIVYVLESLKKNTSAVRNIRAYLITVLYNSLNTIDSYYQATVNYDRNQTFADQVLRSVPSIYEF